MHSIFGRLVGAGAVCRKAGRRKGFACLISNDYIILIVKKMNV